MQTIESTVILYTVYINQNVTWLKYCCLIHVVTSRKDISSDHHDTNESFAPGVDKVITTMTMNKWWWMELPHRLLFCNNDLTLNQVDDIYDVIITNRATSVKVPICISKCWTLSDAGTINTCVFAIDIRSFIIGSGKEDQTILQSNIEFYGMPTCASVDPLQCNNRV